MAPIKRSSRLSRQPSEDRAIARLANVLGASVVSKDADFADLAARGAMDHTFVWLRLPNLSNRQMLERLDLALPEIVSAIDRNDRLVEIR